MGFKMKDLNQLIIKFDYDQNFKDQDFYVSKSNEYSFKLLNSWPKWEKNFLNLIGEKFSGKTHLINIFLKKFKGIKIEGSDINNQILKEIKIYENVVVENLNKDINENLFYTLLNIIEQDNKYLIVTSKKPIVDFSYKLDDLNSRSKNFLLSSIEKPDDDLMFALILKNLSDRQISIDKKLIDFIIKRIDRSYGKIFDFIYKIDEISLKRKKAIETYKYWVDIASALDCKAMRNVCGESITVPHKEKLNYALEGVNELGAYAASKNIDLLIENHNGYSSDPEWMIALMEGVNKKNVGVLGDFTNWTLERNPDTFYPDPYKGIELLAPYIRAVSAKSSEFTVAGEEITTDYKKMFDILKKAPHFEFAGVEFFGNDISRNQGVKLTKNLIEKVTK